MPGIASMPNSQIYLTSSLSEDVKINPTIWLFFSISASLQKSLNSLLLADFAPRIKEK